MAQKNFYSHDWDADAQWKDYLSRIDFLPSNYSSSSVNMMQKLKEKYWKKYVDPAFDPSNPSGSSTVNNNNSNPASTSASSSTNTTNTTHTQSSNNSTSTNTNTNTSILNAYNAWFLCHVVLLWHMVRFLLGYGVPLYYPPPEAGAALPPPPYMRGHSSHYDWILYMAACAHGITLWKAIQADRQQGRGLELQRLLSQDATHYFFLAVSLIPPPPQITLATLAFAIYSVFHACSYLLSYSPNNRTHLANLLPQAALQTYHTRVMPAANNFSTKFQGQAKQFAVHAEFGGGLSMLSWLISTRDLSILLGLFGYYHFLRFRYLHNAYTREFVQQLREAIRLLYHKARSYVRL